MVPSPPKTSEVSGSSGSPGEPASPCSNVLQRSHGAPASRNHPYPRVNPKHQPVRTFADAAQSEVSIALPTPHPCGSIAGPSPHCPH